MCDRIKRIKKRLPRLRDIINLFSNIWLRFRLVMNFEDASTTENTGEQKRNRFRSRSCRIVIDKDPEVQEIMNNVKDWVLDSNFESNSSIDQTESISKMTNYSWNYKTSIKQNNLDDGNQLVENQVAFRTLPATPLNDYEVQNEASFSQYLQSHYYQKQFQQEVTRRIRQLSDVNRFESTSVPFPSPKSVSKPATTRTVDNYLQWIDAAERNSKNVHELSKKPHRTLPDLPSTPFMNRRKYFLHNSSKSQFRSELGSFEHELCDSSEHQNLNDSLDMELSHSSPEKIRLLQLKGTNNGYKNNPLLGNNSEALERKHRNSFKEPRELSTFESDSTSKSFQTNNGDKSSEVSRRFGLHFWKSADNRKCGSKATKDDFHSRYFGRVSHHEVESSLDNIKKGKNPLPFNFHDLGKKEKAKLVFKNDSKEDMAVSNNPKTNESQSSEFENHNKPPYTDEYWKTPKKYVFEWQDLF